MKAACSSETSITFTGLSNPADKIRHNHRCVNLISWFNVGRIVCCEMAESVPKLGLYFDELSKIRVLEPEVAQETNKLKEECRDFVESKY
jgi:hypothetical protein